jgi:hypothetical protein
VAAAPSDADCSVDAARQYRVKPASARGLPVTVRCDGPATFFVARVKLAKYAKRAAKKNLAKRRAFPIFFDMGIERADGSFHNIPKPAAQPYAKIVR